MIATIPPASGSKSKMQQKGWKCWAKLLNSVNLPAKNGFDFDGEFVDTGAAAEVEPGTLLLHYDDSSNHGVAVALPASNGKIRWCWLQSATGNWANLLGSVAHKWLAYTAEERIQKGAAALLAGNEKISDEARPHYEALAAAKAPASDLPEDVASLVRQLQLLDADKLALVLDALQVGK